MMLRGKVAFRGRFVATDEFNRGKPILHRAEEWSQRGKETGDRQLVTTATVNLAWVSSASEAWDDTIRFAERAIELGRSGGREKLELGG